MKALNFILLYVENPATSVEFYSVLLGRKAIESSANFAMFALDNGIMLGLWRRGDVSPEATAPAGAAELAFTLDGKETVDALCAEWRKLDVPIAQAPTAMDFGYTFVALDPDGHRLRAFARAD